MSLLHLLGCLPGGTRESQIEHIVNVKNELLENSIQNLRDLAFIEQAVDQSELKDPLI